MNKTTTLEIFKAGKHTASNGAVLNFSAADLAATASAYNPKIKEAPLVVGHPQVDDPAFGWVKSLQFSAGSLEASPHQVNADFAEMVNAGTYKKMSASFYAPDSPSNPVPGIYYLKHIGFLGGQAPAIKGMRDAAFSAADEGVIEFNELSLSSANFNGYDDRYVAKLFRNIREWFIAEKGIEVADRVLSDWEISSIESAATEEIINNRIESESKLTPNFNETLLGDTMSYDDKARLATLEAENVALKKQQADFAEAQIKTRRDAAHAEHLAFAEGLVKSGQLLPAHKDAVVATLDYVSAPDDAVEFGEGKDKTPLVQALKATLAASATLVTFGEHAKPEGIATTVNFNAPAGFSVDQTNLELHQKAVAFAESNNVSYEVALSKVS